MKRVNFRALLLSTMALAMIVGCGSSTSQLLDQKSKKLTQQLPQKWSFRAEKPKHLEAKISEWMPATVPGVVHTDLIDNSIIDNPFYSTNESQLQWIEHEEWEYRTTFNVNKSALEEQHQELVFKGLDTYAEVSLNDQKILDAENMFLEYRVNVKDIIKEGENTITIKFLSAYAEGLKLQANYSHRFPADNDKGEVKTSVHTRKAPYHFGWDWGPRFVTCGVWRPIFLESWSSARINNVQYIQKSQSEEVATFDAHVTLDAKANEELTITICDKKGFEYYNQDITTTKDNEKITAEFEIKNPKLWWPLGSGEQNLYNLSVIVADKKDGSKLDYKTENIGVRTIRLVQQPDQEGEGRSFYFEVNGEPIFAKGANYIPQDLFLPRVTPEKYEEFIKTCVQSNYNMIRVWGGGTYEEEYFYELCDKYGLMVWQDFIFGCTLYPYDEPFFENVREEAKYNVQRLRNHPSIAIWCGNNEITELWYHWGYQKAYGWSEELQDTIYKGMRALFYELLPDVLSQEDTTRFYHPSSPLYGRGNPKSQIEGDVHYWGVFHDEEPFSVYKDKPGRFSNEYGFQSLACYDTYREYFKPEEMELYSNAMVIHQKNPKGYRVIEEYMVRDLPLVKEDFRGYVYLTQLLQAEGIKIAMEGHRQKRPWTMGSLYWQVNDCWPVASWSSMDSEMRWKALQYYARKSFAPTAISFEAIDSTGQVKLWGVTDRMASQRGEVKLSLMDFAGKELWSEQLDVNIPRNGNQEIIFHTAQELLRGADPKEVMLVAEGEVEGEHKRVIHYFVPFKDLNLPKSDYTLEFSKKGDKSLEVTITANRLLKSVLFEAEAIQENPSEAYFDMVAGESRVVTLNFEDKFTDIDSLGVTVRSLNDFMGKQTEKPITKNVE